jgi:hypothetical protein
MNSIKQNFVLITFLCVALSGCVLSLQPLFTDNEQIHDQALEGTWALEGTRQIKNNQNKTGTFDFRWFPDGKNYSLQTKLKDQGNGEFIAVLGNIGTNRFLQIVPKRPDNIHPKSFYGGHFIQGFSFWKVQADTSKLTLASLNYEWIETMDREKKLDIKHEKQDKFIILTASTEELKAFILKYADDKSAFSDVLSFERKK